jgi:hypothetical protein
MRKECTKENPSDNKGQWSHPDAILKKDNDEVYTDWYACPYCNITFGVSVSA